MLWSHRLLFMKRFTFSPAEEKLLGSTAARRTSCRTSQEHDITALALHPGFPSGTNLCLLSCRRLAEINGFCSYATSHAVFMLLPALVLTRKRVCQVCLIWDPVALKKRKRFLISRSSPENIICIASSRAQRQPHQHRRTPTTLYRSEPGLSG